MPCGQRVQGAQSEFSGCLVMPVGAAECALAKRCGGQRGARFLGLIAGVRATSWWIAGVLACGHLVTYERGSRMNSCMRG